MKKLFIPILTSAVFLLVLYSNAAADQRAYVWTYQYLTVDRGDVEIESYTTLSTPEINHIEGTVSTELQIELEVGMTERFDFALYHIFNQAPNSNLEYQGYKLRTRYRMGEKGKYFADPLIYAEYKGKSDFSEHGLEFKIILAKDIGRLNVALNPILEFEREDKEWEIEPEYALGVSYATSGNLLRFGLEAKGGENGHYIGPVIAHGREHAWVSLGSAVKLSDIQGGKPEFQLRLLVGIGIAH